MERGLTIGEIQLLEAIRDGIDEFIIKGEGKNLDAEEVMSLWFLQNDQQFIEMEYFSEEIRTVFRNVKLTKEGNYFFNPDQRKNDIADYLN